MKMKCKRCGKMVSRMARMVDGAEGCFSCMDISTVTFENLQPCPEPHENPNWEKGKRRRHLSMKRVSAAPTQPISP